VLLEITCYPTFTGTKPIIDFLDHVRGFADPPKAGTTVVYRPFRVNSSYWRWKGIRRPVRSLASVALEAKKKDAVIADLTKYLSVECER